MILYALIFSLAAVVFNLTLPLMAGLYIVDDLGGSTFMSSYAVSFFCIGNILGVPFGKPGSTPLNPIQLYVICLCLMMFFSWQCGIATDYFNFNLFRFLEGIASGPLYILITYRLIPDLAPDRDKGFITSLALLCFSLGPVLAASWGGAIAFYHNWRWLFFSHMLYCLFLIIYVGYGYRKHYKKETRKVEFDTIGYFSYAVGITFIGVALTTGQELDWFRSPLVCFLIITGSLSTLFFIVRCLSSPYPLMDLRLLKKFYFCLAMLNVSLLFAIYFGMIILLSLWLRLYVNYSPLWVVLSIGVTIFGAWIPILIHYKGYDPRVPLAIALISLIISSFYTTTFNVQINFQRIAISRILSGIGLCLFLAPLFRLSMQTFPKEKIAECLNFFHVIRLLGSGLGVALFVTLWHRRQVFYYDRLGSRLTEFSTVTQEFLKKAHQAPIPGTHAFAQLSYYINRQATALALDDCFYLMSWILVFLLGILLATLFFKEPELLDKKEFPVEPELTLNRID
jgi:DHA2 family multidrug resistance protein